MSLWMPLKKRKNTAESFAPGGYELSPEVIWKLYTLAEGLPEQPKKQIFSPPGICIGGGKNTFPPEKFRERKEMPLPKLEFQTYPYLLFLVDNTFWVTVETGREKGNISFPYLSYFDKNKLGYSALVSCGVFSSMNFTLAPSLQRQRFPYKSINRYP